MASIILFRDPKDAYGWLSTWSEHPVEYKNKIFPTVENYILYRKAELFDDQITMEKLADAKDPTEARKIAYKIDNFKANVWKDKQFSIIVQGNILKCEYNDSVFARLQRLPSKVKFGLADKDKTVGIGFYKSDPKSSDTDMWSSNLVGKAWNEIHRYYNFREQVFEYPKE